MANLQVKSIDDDLYESLGRKAAQENRSISQEVVHLLKKHLSEPASSDISASESFLTLCGSWKGEESADTLINDVREGREVSSKHREVDF